PMPTEGHAGITSCVWANSFRMSSVCQIIRFGSGATVPSTQSSCPSLLTRQSLGPSYRPEITTGWACGSAGAATCGSAVTIVPEATSTRTASKPTGRRGERMSLVEGRRREGSHTAGAVVDACKGEFDTAAAQAQRHDEPAFLRQAVALEDFRSPLRRGVDHVVVSVPTRHLLGIALRGGDVGLLARRVLARGIAGSHREGVRLHVDPEVIALRYVGHQLTHGGEMGHRADSRAHRRPTGSRTFGVARRVALPLAQLALRLLALLMQLLDRLAEI